jgi:L-asparaginase
MIFGELMLISSKQEYENKPHIHVLALGGTIACQASTQTEEFYGSPSTNISQLISLLPMDKDKLTLTHEQTLQKISHEMTNDDLLFVAKRINELANQPDVDGIVITHGTNCIEETAYFMNLIIRAKKPVVFTGAFRPANALAFDGTRNLYNAIMIASQKDAFELGIVLTFNDCIVNARDASKFNPSVPSDFSVSGTGIIGSVQGNHLHIHKLVRSKHSYLSEFSIEDIKALPKIYIIYGHLGIDSDFVELAITNNAKGIISAGMGKGYQPEAVTKALIKARQKGIFVVRCSRTGQGIVNREKSIDDQYGFIAGGSLSPQKARLLLAVALNKTENLKDLQRIFNEY